MKEDKLKETLEKMKAEVGKYTYGIEYVYDPMPTRTEGVTSDNEYVYTAVYNHNLPKPLRFDWRAEITPLEAYTQYAEDRNQNRYRKSYHLSRIDLTVPEEEDIKYFYIPGEVSYKVLSGAIEFLFKRDVPYTITNLELSYNDLPKFERKRVMGIK